MRRQEFCCGNEVVIQVYNSGISRHRDDAEAIANVENNRDTSILSASALKMYLSAAVISEDKATMQQSYEAFQSQMQDPLMPLTMRGDIEYGVDGGNVG
jgi:hypothetical protein